MSVETTTKLSKLIQDYIDNEGISLNKFSQQVGLSRTYLASLIGVRDSRTGNPIEPTVETIRKIAKAMNVMPVEVLEKSGYLEPHDSPQEQLRELAKAYLREFFATKYKEDPNFKLLLEQHKDDLLKGNEETMLEVLQHILGESSSTNGEPTPGEPKKGKSTKD